MANKILLRHNKNWGLREELVLTLTNKALRSLGFDEGVELSLWFVGRKRAKDLNLKYRKKSYIPQVLGFPLEKNESIDGLKRLGDIVICTQKLKYESKFQKKPMDKVLFEWLVHGVKNLLIQ